MSKTIKDYFDIQELVCRDTYNKYGNEAWQFLGEHLLANLLWLRENIDKPIFCQLVGNRRQTEREGTTMQPMFVRGVSLWSLIQL